jgi:hypothetical protein
MQICIYIYIYAPVMEADLEPGLAWIVIATEEGGIDRIQEGKLWLGFTEEED